MSAPAPIELKTAIKEMLGTKSGKIGVFILIFLTLFSLMVPFYAPFDVIEMWNNPKAWVDYPKCAAPVWVEWFTHKKLPKTQVFEPGSKNIYKDSKVLGGVYKVIWNVIRFKYDYDEFPNEKTGFKIALIIHSNKNVIVNVTWMRPDGFNVNLFYDVIYVTGETLPIVKEFTSAYPVFKDAAKLFAEKAFKTPVRTSTQVILFAQATEDMNDPKMMKVLKGDYKLLVKAITFDMEGDVDVKFILFGKVYGLAGTDFWGRDLLIAIMWGAPVALTFGAVTAIFLSFLQTIFGIIAGWFGGKVDEGIQKLTEIYMVIPSLPILILISLLYELRIWELVLALIVLSPVGSSTLTIRSMTFQIKEEQHILAIKAYGASGWRIILKHILPRVLPYTLTGIVLSIPSYVFLEAALSFLGLGDPTLPTWGKVLSDAYSKAAVYLGWWWWILIPAGCIIITAFAFALLGYSLDKIVNPRLREM